MLFSRLRLFKQIVGIVLRRINRENELTVFVGPSPGLFDFKAVVGSGMWLVQRSAMKFPRNAAAYSCRVLPRVATRGSRQKRETL